MPELFNIEDFSSPKAAFDFARRYAGALGEDAMVILPKAEAEISVSGTTSEHACYLRYMTALRKAPELPAVVSAESITAMVETLRQFPFGL